MCRSIRNLRRRCCHMNSNKVGCFPFSNRPSGSNLTFESRRGFPPGSRACESGACAPEFPSRLKPGDRRRLKALARDRNAPQKHVWRAEIVLFTADGRRHERDHAPNRQVEDLRLALAGTLHGGRASTACCATRRGPRASRRSGRGGRARRRLDAHRSARRDDPLDRRDDGEGDRASASARSSASGARMAFSRTGSSSSSSPTTRSSSTSCAMSSGSMSIRRPTPSCSRSTRRAKSRPSTAPSPACR